MGSDFDEASSTWSSWVSVVPEEFALESSVSLVSVVMCSEVWLGELAAA